MKFISPVNNGTILCRGSTIFILIFGAFGKTLFLAGFQDWDLKEPYEASYVCKYLSKSLDAKVRASTRYGSVSDEPPPSKTEVNKGGAKRP